jgi:KDO2-lipid IV(A) lauroyltransferase
MGRGAYFFLAKRRHVAISNLKKAFRHLNEKHASRLAKRCFENLGINFVESLILPFIPKQELVRRFAIKDRFYVDEVLALNKGMMALVFHYANWEIMGVASHFLERDIIVLARPLKRHQRINEYLNKLRGETGLTVIPNANTGKDVMRYLKENKIVAILGDQREKRSRGVFVEFFGEKAPTSKGIAMIGMKTRTPVVPFYFRRDGFLRYTIVCSPAIEMERKGNIEDLIYKNTRKINAFLENLLRERPEDWFWLHRRWARKK